jgi:hypothetical protein
VTSGRKAQGEPSHRQCSAEYDPEKRDLGMGGRQPTAATAQTLMPVRAKPAPVTFLPARGTATWSPFRQYVAMCASPGCPYRNCLLLGISAKLFLVGCRIQQPIEAVLLNHPFVPIALALDAILRRIARLGIEPDNRVLAFSRIVDGPIGREFYILPYCKLVMRHVASRTGEVVASPWPLRPVPR